MALYYSSRTLAALPSLTAHSASASPTRLVWIPLSEVHPPSDYLPNIPGPADAQCLGKYNMGKDEGPLGVITPVENTLPLHVQDCHEPAPYCSIGRVVLAGHLRGYSAPTTLPKSIVQDYPTQV